MQMPKILRDEISVHIIQSRDHILNTYSQKISEYAEVRSLFLACKRPLTKRTGQVRSQRDQYRPQRSRQGGYRRFSHVHLQGRRRQDGREHDPERLHSLVHRNRFVPAPSASSLELTYLRSYEPLHLARRLSPAEPVPQARARSRLAPSRPGSSAGDRLRARRLRDDRDAACGSLA